MNTVRRLLLMITVLYVFAAPHARADDASEARRRYDEGKAALQAGRFREAALHFEATSRLRKHAAAPYAAAMAWDKAGEPSRTADNLVRALDMPGLSNKMEKDARSRLAMLEQSLGTLVVTGPDNLTVQFEGSTETTPPARLHAAPGINTLLVARDGDIERRDVMLKAGETVELDVTEPVKEPEPEGPVAANVAPSAACPPPTPCGAASTASAQTHKLIGYSALGAGMLSAGVAITLGLKTLSARDDFEEQRTRDAFNDASSLRMWTNVAWVGAAVLGGAGATLVLWPTGNNNKGREQKGVGLAPTPNGVLVRGSF